MILEDQFKNRHEYIGGSDIPIILGCSKFKSPWELLLEKASIKQSSFGGSVYSELGNILESRIQNGMKLINVDEITYRKEFMGVPFECHIDGLNQEKDQVQEIKVTNQTMDECYKSYEWQIRCYMYVVDLDSARLIQLRREGRLKNIVNGIIRTYDIGFLHDFSTMDEIDVHEIKSNLKLEVDNLALSTGMLYKKVIPRDEIKEQYMLSKIAEFWEFRNKLIDNKELVNSNDFREQFRVSFKDY